MDFRRPIPAVIPGAQGRILAVLAETSGELNLRAIARLAGVSIAQASRVLPGLVELGILDRRDSPPSAFFRFVPENVAARAITALADSRRGVLDILGQFAGELDPPPASVIVVGSFARGEADRDSDLDLVVVRAPGVEEDDPRWRAGQVALRERARRLTGNPVEIIEIDASDIRRAQRSRKPFWLDVRQDGVVVFGASLDDLQGRRSA